MLNMNIKVLLSIPVAAWTGLSIFSLVALEVMPKAIASPSTDAKPKTAHFVPLTLMPKAIPAVIPKAIAAEAYENQHLVLLPVTSDLPVHQDSIRKDNPPARIRRGNPPVVAPALEIKMHDSATSGIDSTTNSPELSIKEQSTPPANQFVRADGTAESEQPLNVNPAKASTPTTQQVAPNSQSPFQPASATDMQQSAGKESSKKSTSTAQVSPLPPENDLLSPPASPASQSSEDAEETNDGMDQITNVSQFSDVPPGEWAYEALRELVERYGCIAGYPNGTFRGNRALSRYEFAAGVRACLNQVEKLIAASTTDFAQKEDLEKLRRLENEFQGELATLATRVGKLENRADFLESHQFSATTKLNGLVWFNLTGAFVNGKVTAERGIADNAFAAPRRNPVTLVPSRVQRSQPNITLAYYAWLTLTTSFTGKDSLITQLAVGNGSSPANQLVSAGFFNSWGTPFLDQSGTPNPGTVVIRELAYSFPVTNNVRISVGPRVNWYRYFDGNRFNFFLTGTSSYNSNGSTLLNAVDRGAGGVVSWNINKQLAFTAAYLGENTEFVAPPVFNTASNAAQGLFNSTNTTTAQLAYTPNNNFSVKLIYNYSNIKPYNGFIGGTVGEPLPYGYADDGFGGRLRNSTANAYVANFDWLITKNIGIFGRYSYGSTNIDPVNRLRSGGRVNVQSYQVGLGFPDLGKKGALGVISFLVPHDYLSGRKFLLSAGGNGGTQYELEASYYYPITSNIAIVPAFYAIWKPNNFDGNPTVYVTNLRTQFSF